MRTKRDEINSLVQESGETLLESGMEEASVAGKIGLDELDAAILRHLERYGRATNYEVGEAVGLSASAAWEAHDGVHPRQPGAPIGSSAGCL